MTAKGHVLFSISCAIFSKNIALTSVLNYGDWWNIIFSSTITSLLPDLDHPKSFLSKRFKYISNKVTKFCSHRGFTHSLLILILISVLLYLEDLNLSLIPDDFIQGMLLGYLSHIIADMFTPNGVPLLWPYRPKFRFPIVISKKKQNKSEQIICLLILMLSFLISKIIN